MQQRHFTSGSRQAPDPFDQFLEENDFYRKHTARDASCLFRVISEQMYDTQSHHLFIREHCVTYMRRHRKLFEGLVDRDFNEYLDDMLLPKTYGTLVELQAAGYLFKRNVFLFEPFNLGNYFPKYRPGIKDVFRVFYTPERHFDSVFTSEYIEEVAICQSIVYEILYKDVFKLPDVAFAVEQMLHGSSHDDTEYRTDVNEDGYATRVYLNDEREFDLDLPNNTNCILENYKLCHFHYSNFPRLSDDLQRERKGTQAAESFLPNKYTSCVRQLLQEGITPFPYKVAKALDPSMYRNIEFDSWNEMRKEIKLQNWYNGDTNFKFMQYQSQKVRQILQVGAKCHVMLSKSEQDLYTCHIQDIEVDKGQCIVYIEQLGEKRLVPYENLRALPPDQFKPWTVPYRFQRHVRKLSSIRLTRQYNYRFKLNSTTDGSSNGDYIDDNDSKRQQQFLSQKFVPASYYKLKRYTHLENFRAHTVEFCTMPLTVQHNGGGELGDTTNSDNSLPAISADNNEDPRANSTSSDIVNGSNTALDVQDPSTAVVPADLNPSAPTVGYGIPQSEGIYNLETYNGGTTIYVPELQNYCQVYPYSTLGGMPEDFYGYYGYDGALTQVPAYMSAPNGGYYYVCSNGTAPPGSYVNAAVNPYVAGPPAIALQVPPPPSNIPLYANTHYAPSGVALPCPTTPNTANLPSSTENTMQNSPSPQQRVEAGGTQTESNVSNAIGRIHYDAKKSFKSNGSDLPTDIATLRFFYNLGWDSYNQNKPKQELTSQKRTVTNTSELANDDNEQLATDLQFIRLNARKNAADVTVKSDANNNAILPESASSSEKPTTTQSTGHNKNSFSSSSTSTGGSKTNHRRYNSRLFNGKERQMPHHQHQQNRTYDGNCNSNMLMPFSGTSHHNFNHQHMRNSNGSYKYKNYSSHSMTVSGRGVYENPQGSSSRSINPGQQQVMMTDQGTKNSAYDDAPSNMGRNGNSQCNMPKTRGPLNGTGNEYINDSVPIAAAPAGGMYVPMTMPGPPPPLSYELYASHATPNGFQAISTRANFVNGQMHISPPALIPGIAHSIGSGSDGMENNGNGSDMSNCMVNMGTGMPPPLQCTSYPPPPIPYYLGTGGGDSLHPNGPPDNPGIHFIAHMGPPTPTNVNMPQQFSAPPPPLSSIGPQGYICLPSPQGQMPPPHQQQQSMQNMTMTNNNNNIRDGVPGGVSSGTMGTHTADSVPNANNNCARPEESSANNNDAD